MAYLKSSMREPRKLRKLLCRLMWLSSSSLILPKTYRREKKGLGYSDKSSLAREAAAHSAWLQEPILRQVQHPQLSQHPRQLISTLCTIPPW